MSDRNNTPPPTGADIALLTDFGLTDWYVAAMKAAIRPISPGSMLIDLTHAIAPGDIACAAFVLAQAHADFREGTVFCVVVDPGVGSARRPLVATDGRRFFVGPDNGVLSLAAAECEIWRCHVAQAPQYRRETLSATFHGRDVFAPAAAWLARGAPLATFGPPAPDMITLSDATPRQLDDGRWMGRVVYIDRFGNALTSFRQGRPPFADAPAPSDALTTPEAAIIIRCGAMVCRGLRRAFSDVEVGASVAYWGSSGRLEIGVNQGHAARQYGLRPGDAVYAVNTVNTGQ